MRPNRETAFVQRYGALTPLGDVVATHAALLKGEVSLRPTPVQGTYGGDLVPLSLMDQRPLSDTLPPVWERYALRWKTELGGDQWGTERRPVVVTSSNFGVGSQFEYRKGGGDRAHLGHGAPARSVERLARAMGWGQNIFSFSHACVSAHIGILHATRLLAAGLADQVLIFSFDFLSPFVTGGFHALKILNGAMPAPYVEREFGSVGLGDGTAFVVLGKEHSNFEIIAQRTHNEMHHFTANQADGSGFEAVMQSLAEVAPAGRTWVKGHGTGTVDAGRLEANAVAQHFPGAPLVGWKGSLGHTLGSCGLVELAVVCASLEEGTAPGTVGSVGTPMNAAVALAPVDVTSLDHVVCLSNAFGGAHAGFVLRHA